MVSTTVERELRHGISISFTFVGSVEGAFKILIVVVDLWFSLVVR